MTRNLTYAVLVWLCVTSIVHATRPWPTMVVKRRDGSPAAKLQPSQPEAVVLLDASTNVACSFSTDEFNLPVQVQSTAGYIWYANAIAFVDAEEHTLIIRLKEPRIVAIDLISRKVLRKMPEHLSAEVNRTLHDAGVRLLKAPDPRDRQTGAIVCGQLKIREAVSTLRSLLTDSTYLSQKSGDAPWVNVYYVRKAAKEALEAMGERVADIQVEIVTGTYVPSMK